jgi:hypothetical protein
LAALNLQYWQAGKPHTLVAPLTWEGEGNAGTCPVGGTEGGNNSTIYLPLALR